MPIRNFNQKAVKIIWSCRQTSAHAAVTRKLTCKVAPLQASEDLTHVQRAEPSSQPTVLCGGTSLNPAGVREEKLQCYSKSQQSVRLQMTGGWGVCRRRFGVGGAQVRFQGQQLLPEVTPRRHSFCAVRCFSTKFFKQMDGWQKLNRSIDVPTACHLAGTSFQTSAARCLHAAHLPTSAATKRCMTGRLVTGTVEPHMCSRRSMRPCPAPHHLLLHPPPPR